MGIYRFAFSDNKEQKPRFANGWVFAGEGFKEVRDRTPTNNSHRKETF